MWVYENGRRIFEWKKWKMLDRCLKEVIFGDISKLAIFLCAAFSLYLSRLKQVKCTAHDILAIGI
jgi:hypothetical protein